MAWRKIIFFARSPFLPLKYSPSPTHHSLFRFWFFVAIVYGAPLFSGKFACLVFLYVLCFRVVVVVARDILCRFVC